MLTFNSKHTENNTIFSYATLICNTKGSQYTASCRSYFENEKLVWLGKTFDKSLLTMENRSWWHINCVRKYFGLHGWQHHEAPFNQRWKPQVTICPWNFSLIPVCCCYTLYSRYSCGGTPAVVREVVLFISLSSTYVQESPQSEHKASFEYTFYSY